MTSTISDQKSNQSRVLANDQYSPGDSRADGDNPFIPLTRQEQFRLAGESTQALWILLYGSADQFILTTQMHPIEQYIKAYDETVGEFGVARAIAQNMGILLPFGGDTDVDFYDIISRYITQARKTGKLELLAQALTMSEETYDKYLTQRQLNIIQYPYNRRTDLIMGAIE